MQKMVWCAVTVEPLYLASHLACTYHASYPEPCPPAAFGCRSLQSQPPEPPRPDLPQAASRHGESPEERCLPGSQVVGATGFEPARRALCSLGLASGLPVRSGVSSRGECSPLTPVAFAPCCARSRVRAIPHPVASTVPPLRSPAQDRAPRGEATLLTPAAHAHPSEWGSQGGLAPLNRWSGRLDSNQRAAPSARSRSRRACP